MEPVYAGIDVSKATIDVAIPREKRRYIVLVSMK